MDKLRSGEMTRKAVSFFLAVGLHALLFMIQASGYWGAGGDELGYTLIQPRLVEIESVRREVRAEQPKPQVTPKPPTPPAQKTPAVEQPASAVEQPLTKIEEVHQEKSAPRETQPEPGEVAFEASPTNEDRSELGEIPENGTTDGEGEVTAEGETPSAPVLPPLGRASGMIGFIPSFTFPKNAEHLGVEGTVLMEIYLSPEGNFLKEPVMLASSGHRVLDEHGQRLIASGQLRFKPASEPYKLQMEIRYFYNEENGKYEVEPVAVGEAAYLSTEEGGS
jgi:outer membrane biosynthesis protein TonB